MSSGEHAPRSQPGLCRCRTPLDAGQACVRLAQAEEGDYTAVASPWSALPVWQWIIDAVVIVSLSAIHLVVWLPLDVNNKVKDQAGASEAGRGAASASLTATGILLPLTVIAVQLTGQKITLDQ